MKSMVRFIWPLSIGAVLVLLVLHSGGIGFDNPLSAQPLDSLSPLSQQ